MPDERSRLYAALNKIRHAKTDKEANAAQAEAANIGLHVAKKVADPKRRKQALKDLDADIARANRQRRAG